MRGYKLGIALSFLFYGTTAIGQPQCDAPELSVDKIREIIATERAKRSDLPKPYSSFTWIIVREECHYFYFEDANDFDRTKSRYFILNQRGVIVDQTSGHP